MGKGGMGEGKFSSVSNELMTSCFHLNHFDVRIAIASFFFCWNFSNRAEKDQCHFFYVLACHFLPCNVPVISH